jgi:glucose dehydrogenase
VVRRPAARGAHRDRRGGLQPGRAGRASGSPAREWPTYGGTNANRRYSSLDQIHRDNVSRLRIAWRWPSPDRALIARQPDIRTWANQATPIMISGVLYVSTSASQVAAIDATSGRTIWVHDPPLTGPGCQAAVCGQSAGVGSARIDVMKAAGLPLDVVA